MSKKSGLSDDPFRALDDLHNEIVDEIWEAFELIGRRRDLKPEDVEDIFLDLYEAVDEEMMH